MTNERERLAEAKRKLVATLSGREVKQNGTPTGNNIGYRDMAAQIKLNQCKREMVQTLSGGKKSDGFDDGVLVMEIPQDQIQKQAAARSELRGRLAGTYRKGQQKQNQCPLATGSSGFKSVVEDSNATNTASGVPFTGGWQITGRGGTVTLASILSDERNKADEDSPSPAVVSGQTGTADWSPDSANGDYTSDQPFDADKAKADLLAHYTSGKTGKISGYAKRYF